MGGGAVTVMAAAAAARRRRMQEVVDAFRVGDATSADRARPIESLGVAQVREVDDLIADGVLAEGREPGTYYLNEAMYIAARERLVPRRKLLVVMAILLVVGAGMLAILARGQ
jgi:hypothetical protein